MRTLTRKLLSLLLVFTMVCAMVPAAMAADETETEPETPTTVEHDPATHTDFTYERGPNDQHTKKCKTTGCTFSEVENCTASPDEYDTSSAYEHHKTCQYCKADFAVGDHVRGNGAANYFDERNHTFTCTVCNKSGAKESHTWVGHTSISETEHSYYCSVCQSANTQNKPHEEHDFSEYTEITATTHKMKCYDCGYISAAISHTYIMGNNTRCECGARNPATSSQLEIEKTPGSSIPAVPQGETPSFSVNASVIVGDIDITENCVLSYAWTLDGASVGSNSASYSLPATTSAGRHSVTCTVTATYGGQEVDQRSCSWTVNVVQNTLRLNEDSITLTGRNDDFDLVPTVTAEGYTAKDVKWSMSKTGIVELDRYNDGSVRVFPLKNGTVDVVATLDVGNQEYTAVCEITVKGVDAEISVGATVFNTNPGYALGDEDDDGDTSIVDQIRDEIDDITDGEEDLKYVKFYSPVDFKDEGELDVSTKESYYLDPGKNDEDISDVVFIPDEEYKGKVTFNFLAVDTDGYEYDGEIVFDVEEGTASAGDIIYPAKSGDDVEFDVNDFEDFWEDKYSKGSLDYVTFGSVSSSRGDLVDADGDKVSSRTKYYADPTSKQADLDGVTFEPGRNTKTTVTIDFTAHGTNNSKRDAELSGTVVILYTEKDPEAIVYSSTGKNITLDADDFLDNYKDTMGSSASNIQIQFLEVPSNGTLYYNYNERTEKGTELTSKNVANHTFSTSSRASKSIEDVTYVPDSRGRSDTVRFACYTSGGDLRYYGEVTFGQTVQNVTVNMTSTSSGVTFQASTFFNADDALLSANTISFGTPSSGTLYKNWNGTSGTRVTASDMFSYVASVTGNASISTVTYVPVAGYSGTVTIPFSAYGAAGGIVSGTVSIRVTATTPTTIFTDVPTTGSQAWAYPFINRLAAAGVVSGVTPTTYGPKQTVKWGEALKMVLLGAGHPAQVEGTGSNWASGYLTYAVNNGIVSNTNINLSSNITRLEMAELAAKALGMSPASRINTGIVGPTDTTNGYVYALYNAGIVGGDSSSGQNRYNGGSTLLRDEMAKIVCGVMDNA